MTATAAPLTVADVVEPGKDRKIKAKASGRKIEVRNHAVVTIRRTFFAWLFGVKKVGKKGFKQPLPNSVEFYVHGIEKIKWKQPWFVFSGCFTIYAPAGDGDRWRRSGKEKPHRLRFSRGKQQARMLALAWAINLGAQRWGGEPLGALPNPMPLDKAGGPHGAWLNFKVRVREILAAYR